MRAALWVEGVNFALTLEDTSDLSTLRGGSLALNRLGSDLSRAFANVSNQSVTYERVIDTAARAAFIFEGDLDHIEALHRASLEVLASGADPDEIQRSSDAARTTGTPPTLAPYAHMSVVAGIAYADQGEDDNQLLRRAQALARIRQQTTFSPPDWRGAQSADEECPKDRRRPATVTIFEASGEDGAPGRPTKVSAAVAARRHFGRAQRQMFYREALPRDVAESWDLAGTGRTAAFADSLHEIIKPPPAGLRPSVEGKIAVLHFDGNGFGAIRKALGGGLAAHRTFSPAVDKLLRERLLPRLLTPFVEARSSTDPRARTTWVAPTDRGDRLRFETLLWAGDEMRFVAPAWLGLELARIFFENIGGPEWAVDGHRLTFAGGLVLAPHKTPIRTLRVLADEQASAAKSESRTANRLSVASYESIDPAIDEVGKSHSAFILDAEPGRLADLMDRVARIGSAAGVSRAQLHRWISLAETEFRGTEARAGHELEAAVNRFLQRAGADRALTLQDLLLTPAEGTPSWTSLLRDLRKSALLLDYVVPFKDGGRV